MKKLFLQLPEYYLILLAFLAGYTPPFYVNPFMLVIIAILIAQLIFKNKVFGLLLGVIFFVGNLYFLGALLSEFYEFPTFDSGAQKLIVVGLSIWSLNMVAAGVMLYKYRRTSIQLEPSVLE